MRGREFEGGGTIKKARATAEIAAAGASGTAEESGTEVSDSEAYRIREQRARRLFNEWTGVANPEIRSALWHNLSAEDRSHWCDRADEETGKESLRTPDAPPHDPGKRAALS